MSGFVNPHEHIARLEERIEALEKENSYLRALVGNSDKACVYCGLGADEQYKCASGFPGCARADDQILCRNFGGTAALAAVQFELQEAIMLLHKDLAAYKSEMPMVTDEIEQFLDKHRAK